MNRREMLKYLRNLGFKTPEFGKVKDMTFERLGSIRDIMPEEFLEVIVYIDETKHKGEGKMKMSYREALEKYPNHLCTEYIMATPNDTGYTWRYLQAGQKRFLLSYQSFDHWQSNVGEGEVKVLTQLPDEYHKDIRLPLFAIDLLVDPELLAIDFNIAPQLGGTGIEKIVPAIDMAKSVKDAIVYFTNRKGEDD